MATEEEISNAVRAAASAREDVELLIQESCPGPHRYVQHRDRRPPWCKACRYTSSGQKVPDTTT